MCATEQIERNDAEGRKIFYISPFRPIAKRNVSMNFSNDIYDIKK